MPLDQTDLNRLKAAEDDSNKVVTRAPSETQKLGFISVMCLVINRKIGSGIYVGPAIMLRGTNSVGITLLLWGLGPIIAIPGLLVWLELGLTIPKFDVEGSRVSVPRSGGEKNYLEHIYSRPQFLTTCLYGIVFIILGNLAGNAIVFGIYIMRAAGQPEKAWAVRVLAVAALTIACLIHVLWRRGGIVLNNILAVVKVAILVLIIILGFAVLGGASFGNGRIQTSNFNILESFSGIRSNVASYADSFVYVMYAFSGFEQPFYVLSEVSRPRKNFAKATLSATGLMGVLFVLVNIAYFCVVSKAQVLATNFDMATLFFGNIFGNDVATRVMAAIIAISVFGNIVVMTFTASRVKQEIAKEGILPFSRFFAKSTITTFACLEVWWRSRKDSTHRDEMMEQSPAAALLLHWTFSVILIGATSGRAPPVAYTILVSLYAYVLVILTGFFVASGLLYLRFRDKGSWTRQSGFKPWGGPAAAIIYSVSCAFLLIAMFLPPSTGSPFSIQTTHVPWYVGPTVGLGSLLVGTIYFLGFHYIIPWRTGRNISVERLPIIVGDEYGELVQSHEIIEVLWVPRQPADEKRDTG